MPNTCKSRAKTRSDFTPGACPHASPNRDAPAHERAPLGRIGSIQDDKPAFPRGGWEGALGRKRHASRHRQRGPAPRGRRGLGAPQAGAGPRPAEVSGQWLVKHQARRGRNLRQGRRRQVAGLRHPRERAQAQGPQGRHPRRRHHGTLHPQDVRTLRRACAEL